MKESHADLIRVKHSFTRAQASRPWIHAAFAAVDVAAHAVVSIYIPHSVINIVL